MPMLVAPTPPVTRRRCSTPWEGSDDVFPVVVGDYVDDLPWLQQLAPPSIARWLPWTDMCARSWKIWGRERA